MNFTVEYSNRPEQRRGTHLILMLHGYGSNEHDLLQLGEVLGGELTYAGLRAPQPVGTSLTEIDDTAEVAGAAMGYQWYPLTNTLESNQHAVELAVDYVVEFLETEISGYESVSLLGFSQGMAVATSVARRRPDLVRTVIGCSGFVIVEGQDYFRDEEFAAGNMPVFYGRGDADTVISPARVEYATEWLQANAQVELHVYSGLPHSINAEEIRDIARFVQKHIL